MILSYDEILLLVRSGGVDSPEVHVRTASLDLTLHPVILVEKTNFFKRLVRRLGFYWLCPVIDLSERDVSLHWDRVEMTEDGYVTHPVQFVLASSAETFNMPDDISAEFQLKSSLARNGLDHLNAGWIDAGWRKSKLTLELVNVTGYHRLRLRPGMKIGQVKFFRHKKVSPDASYSNQGRYNDQTEVTASKGNV